MHGFKFGALKVFGLISDVATPYHSSFLKANVTRFLALTLFIFIDLQNVSTFRIRRFKEAGGKIYGQV
jgi:hypothetical protein